MTATVSDSVPDSVTNIATVAMPAGQTDPVPANNTAIDVDAVAAPRLSVALSAGAPTVVGPTSFEVPYTIDVANTGAVPAQNLQVSDVLSSVFADGSPAIAIAAPPTTTSSCTANGGFSGIGSAPSSATNLLSGSTLGIGQACTIRFTVHVTYPTAAAIPSASQNNRVTASAGTSRQVHVEAEAPVRLILPRVDVTEAVTGVTQLDEEPVFDIGFLFVLRNTTEADAHNIQLIDSLAQTFAAGSPTITIQSGPTLGALMAA